MAMPETAHAQASVRSMVRRLLAPWLASVGIVAAVLLTMPLTAAMVGAQGAPTGDDLGVTPATVPESRRDGTTTLPGTGLILSIGGRGVGDEPLPGELLPVPSPPELLPMATPTPVPTPTPKPTPAPAPSPRPTRAEVEAELGALVEGTDWTSYRQSPAGAAFDPFEAGAQAAVLFDRLDKDLHRSVDYAVLFRFRNARRLADYWDARAAAAGAQAPVRDRPCADGQPGQGSWAHGRILCYVSGAGHALIRWTDERSNTYGVMNASPGSRNLNALYRHWRSALTGLAERQPTAKARTPDTAERALLRRIPRQIRKTCEPRRSRLPAGAVAAVQCRPKADPVGGLSYYLMEQADANSVVAQVIWPFTEGYVCGTGEGLPSCDEVGCAAGVPDYSPGLPYGGEGCFLDANGIANVRFVNNASNCYQLTVGGRTLREPLILVAAMGNDGDISRLWRWADGRRLTQGIRQKGAAPSDLCPHW